MSRLLFSLFTSAVILIAVPPLPAQPRENESIATVLAVQNALFQGRQHLLKGEAKQAVELLESKLPYINGNRDYLATLRDAYWARLKELQRDGQDDRVPQILERLRVLDPTAKLDGYSPASSLATPASAIPAAAEPKKTRGQTDDGDPFQQTPIADRAAVRDLIRRADAAFREQRFAEAAQLFEQASAKDPEGLGASRPDWAYCLLNTAVARLNQTAPGDAAGLDAIEKDVKRALSLAGNKAQLMQFGQTALARVREARNGVVPVAAAQPPEGAGWTTAESANFRLFHRQPPDSAARLLAQAEKIRAAAFEKWFGLPNADWNPRCDIHLHPTAADYSRATQGHPQSHGHSTVEVRESTVVRRRLDLVAENPGLLSAALPREVTHLVLADLYPAPLLPRWADEAMAILAEPRANVDRYLKALPRVRKEGRLIPVGKLLTSTEFPEPASITTFYVQSVSLTDMLVSLRGPKAFAIFLQDARRYGYEKALERNYGIRDFSDLQNRWQRQAFGG